ncbi:protein translocase subunit SecF [Clostridium thermobutyricum]|uniref:Protein-export membrane protein SecF n=1 Tax=Clostridium thermobutyricum DSM 4928 TaxID=1121339 RepID=A0A1V4SW77_9CLOT|nr:protein translocase subunit SecF [Clostridium thermobutyricum]OPX48361.1 protein-export membrane protein SecF [Clostridium thermobutyricum DSM 4928]
MLKIIDKWKIWFSLSLIVIIIGIGCMIYRGGLNFGIDFKGGTQVIFDLGNGFNKAQADKIVNEYVNDATTNTVNSNEYEIKSANLTSEQVTEIFNKFKTEFKVGDKALVSQNQIGASIGKELTDNAIIALGIAFICMLVYIAIRFEFKFGLAALIALFHDILITVSVYAIFNITVNSPFIAAILTVVGYSMNDSIVIFDRIRENMKFIKRTSPREVANKSVNQTMARSINTTATTLVTIIAVYIFVPSVRDFAFPLIVGIAAGAYSSIFIASPVWVMLKDRSLKKGKRKKEVVVEELP